MLYTEKTKRALEVSFLAHKEQIDKGGLPYVYHPYHLAESLLGEDEVTLALLHDVVEDCGEEWPFSRLEQMNFGSAVMTALRLITHEKEEPYVAYVRSLAENPLARAVKLADLHHNLDETRLPEKAIDGQKRTLYVFCLSILERYPDYETAFPFYLRYGLDPTRFLRANADGSFSELIHGQWMKPQAPFVPGEFLPHEDNTSLDLTYRESDRYLRDEEIEAHDLDSGFSSTDF